MENNIDVGSLYLDVSFVVGTVSDLLAESLYMYITMIKNQPLFEPYIGNGAGGGGWLHASGSQTNVLLLIIQPIG
jgi:hypothetical protein